MDFTLKELEKDLRELEKDLEYLYYYNNNVILPMENTFNICFENEKLIKNHLNKYKYNKYLKILKKYHKDAFNIEQYDWSEIYIENKLVYLKLSSNLVDIFTDFIEMLIDHHKNYHS